MTSPTIEPAAKTVIAPGADIRIAQMGLWPKRYDLMDGFRGIAALTVVCFHHGFLPFGNYGVILFFVISGYCILASADSCQKQNLGVRGFAARRFRRIYPPYLCALVFFILTRLFKMGMRTRTNLRNSACCNFFKTSRSPSGSPCWRSRTPPVTIQA